MPDGNVKILIVDDEPIKRTIMEDELRTAGYSVTCASNPFEVESDLREQYFDVIITDLRMPGKDGMTFLRDLKKQRPDQAVIVMTAYGTIETAVEAMKLGAYDYLQKPFSTAELLLKLNKLLQYKYLASENEALRQELALKSQETRIIGQSKAIRDIWARIHALAGIDTTVLIEGESGTGKELVAKAIHESSVRAKKPFIAVSCAALPKELVESELFGHEVGAFTGATKQRIGRFELAHNGTLFLDDVDDIPVQVQVKLLRVLQENTIERLGSEKPTRVNVRVIAATKRSLAALVAAGSFREDLYYRLNVVPIYLPPLRNRLEDIPLLAEHFIETLALKLHKPTPRISPDAIAKLQKHHWHGNVRELKHVLERMIVLSNKDVLQAEDVPPLASLPESTGIISMALENVDEVNLENVVEEVERKLVRWALERSEGNLARAAQILNIPRSTLQYKVSKLEDV